MPDDEQKREPMRPHPVSAQPISITAHVERRRTPRFSCTISCVVRDLSSNAVIQGRATDLGLGGCYVDSMSAFPIHSKVIARLGEGNRSFEAQADVIYANPGMGMGLAFTQVGAEHLEVLRGWVRELSGEGGPPPVKAVAPEPSPKPAAPPPTEAEEAPPPSERLVLNQLISLLVRKRLLTPAEGDALLRELFR